MNTKNKIVAMLMAGIVAMAVGVPMAIGDDVSTSANVGDISETYDCTATVSSAPGPGTDGTVDFELVVTDDNGAGDIPDMGWTAEWGGRPNVTLLINNSKTTDTSETFEGSDAIPYCTAPGDHPVSFQKDDVEVCTDNFNVGSYTGFTLGFSAIDYNGVNVNEKKFVTPGDLHNTGNSNMTIKINATKMTPGETYNETDPNNEDMNQSARVPGGVAGQEQSLPAYQWVSFVHEFECCTPQALDFSITAPQGTSGVYTGRIAIEAQ